MKRNPFIGIAEDRRPEVVEAWVSSGAIENRPSAWDLLTMADEWNIYTLGEIRRLADIAGAKLDLPALSLDQLLRSPVVTDAMKDEWIQQTKSLEDVYVGLILEFLKTP